MHPNDQCEEVLELTAMCRKLLAACEKSAQWEMYFHQSGKMYDPKLGCDKVIFESKSEIPNPCGQAIRECSEMIK